MKNIFTTNGYFYVKVSGCKYAVERFKTWLKYVQVKKFHTLTPLQTKVGMLGRASRLVRKLRLWRRWDWWTGQSSMSRVFQPYLPSYPRLWLPPSSQQKLWHLKIEKKSYQGTDRVYSRVGVCDGEYGRYTILMNKKEYPTSELKLSLVALSR